MFGALVFLYRVELHMQFSSGGTTVVYQSQQKLYIGLLSYETSNYTWLTIRRDWGRCYCIDENTNNCRLVPWWTFHWLNSAAGSSKWNRSSRTWLFSSHPKYPCIGILGVDPPLFSLKFQFCENFCDGFCVCDSVILDPFGPAQLSLKVNVAYKTCPRDLCDFYLLFKKGFSTHVWQQTEATAPVIVDCISKNSSSCIQFWRPFYV
jgi:hypothetical protein